MSEPFVGEIQMVGFNFAPRGWAICDGQILPIAQNQSLYSLLGTTYGGDGRTSFALPDLRSRAPLHKGGQHPLGQRGGQEDVALSATELPAHTHSARAQDLAADSSDASGNMLAEVGVDIYHTPTNVAAMHSATLQPSGGDQVHDNMQPYQTLNFIIALQGLFPSRN